MWYPISVLREGKARRRVRPMRVGKTASDEGRAWRKSDSYARYKCVPTPTSGWKVGIEIVTAIRHSNSFPESGVTRQRVTPFQFLIPRFIFD